MEIIKKRNSWYSDWFSVNWRKENWKKKTVAKHKKRSDKHLSVILCESVITPAGTLGKEQWKPSNHVLVIYAYRGRWDEKKISDPPTSRTFQTSRGQVKTFRRKHMKGLCAG